MLLPSGTMETVDQGIHIGLQQLRGCFPDIDMGTFREARAIGGARIRISGVLFLAAKGLTPTAPDRLVQLSQDKP